MARQRLEEFRTFLEEDLHNVSLQEEAAKLEMAPCLGFSGITSHLLPSGYSFIH